MLREPVLIDRSWCGYIYPGESDLTHAHHLEFAYLIVCNFCKNIEGFFHIGPLFSGQKAVVLQDAKLYVSTWSLRP